MKNMKKYLLILLLTVLLTVMCAVPAYAADATVTFHGHEQGFTFAPGSKYTPTDLFDNFKNVMPGDILHESVTVVNKSKDSDYIKLYIRAKIHDENGNPLSYNESHEMTDGKDQAAVSGQRDETVASMHDFLSQLTLTVKNGDTVIYQASPDRTDGLSDPVFLGELRYDDTVKLNLTLTVPTTLGNKYANRVGEVDWVFLSELFNDPVDPPDPPTPPDPPKDPHNVIVNKVWHDNGHVRPDSITVRLLRDGTVYDTVTLNASCNWSYAWANMDPDSNWTVEEDVPAGYTASYSVDSTGTVTTIVNTGDPIDPIDPIDPVDPVDPVIPERSLTVRKIWVGDDADQRPASVTVALLRSGEPYAETVLNEENHWTYTWTGLSANENWTAAELLVPENYTVSYAYNETGDTLTITNTRKEDGEDPVVPTLTSLTVQKQWVDDGINRPEAIDVDLMCGDICHETVTITAEDNWTFTWDSLDAAYSWSVVEHPCDGYVTEYSISGTETVITNTRIVPSKPQSITVKKNWDITYDSEHPESVEIVLYDGEVAVETVLLGAWNNWTFTWDNLDADGNWRVLEDHVPLGYTPSYSVKDSVVTVTNTQTLIQTGQLNWPIPVFGGLGCMILGIGILLMAKKKEHNNGT